MGGGLCCALPVLGTNGEHEGQLLGGGCSEMFRLRGLR